MTPPSRCRVERFSPASEDDRRMLAFLQGLAAGQKQHFMDVFPWETKLGDLYTMFVAMEGTADRPSYEDLLAAPPQLCGWLNMVCEDRHGQRAAYVSQVSSRKVSDPAYKGIGTALMMAAEADARTRGVAYMYLMPLDNVTGFYARLGYARMHPDLKYWVKPVTAQPNKRNVSQFVRKNAKAAMNPEEHIMQEITAPLTAVQRQRFKRLVTATPDRLYEAYEVFGATQDPDDVIAHFKLDTPSRRRRDDNAD